MDTEAKVLLDKIKGRSYQGSSVHDAKTYHELPFPGFETIPAHRKGTLERWNLIRRESEVDFSNLKVLDIGCSVGAMSILAAQQGASVTGIDHDDQSIEMAKLVASKLKLDINFQCSKIDLEAMKRWKPYDCIIWLAQWMWMVKQYGIEVGKDMLFEISRLTKILIFESASDDGMAAIKGATQDDIQKWLWENTMYSSVVDIGFVPGWNNRHTFICKVPILIWRGYTASIVRTTRTKMRKQFKPQFGWMAEREAECLRRMRNHDHFPKVFDVGKDWLDISYCGNRLPIKDKQQCVDIMKALKECGIKHRDINPKNLLTMNDKLYLVDFGWSLMDDELDTPMAAPPVLGGRWYTGKSDDDETAMNIILTEAGL